ncbi:MAG: hypothetical protein HY681_07695, partial [Chloroflexi bacterium]|nr:hypothetical protein [Chloroflexota bacterium]
VLGALDRVNIVPQEVSVSPRQAVQFNVIAYDTNGVRLFDVIAAWEVLNPAAGTIDDLGFFIAGAKPGAFTDVIRVRVRVLQSGQGGR